MAKSPKGRHSRTAKDPVTIDLEADKVPDKTREATAKPGEKLATSSDATGEPAKAAAEPRADKVAAAQSQKTSTNADKSATTGRVSDETAAKQSDKTSAPQSAFAGSSSAAGGKASSQFPGTAAPPPPGATSSTRRGGGLIGGIIGGAIVLAGILAIQWAGLWPTADDNDNNEGRITALESGIGEVRQSMAELELAAGDDAAAERIEAMEGEFQNLRGDLDALQTELAELSDSEPDEVDLTPVEDRLAALEETVPDAEAGDARMAEIEQRLDGLAQRLEEQAGSASAALVIAASSLQAAAERGGDFTGELNTLAQLAPETDGLEELRSYAETGVAPRARLAGEVDQAANAMIQAARSQADPDAGFMERLFSSAEGLVAVRPVGEVEGDDVPARVARLEAAVHVDDYDRAIAEYETLPDASQEAGRDFIEQLRARQEVDELVSRVVADAMSESE